MNKKKYNANVNFSQNIIINYIQDEKNSDYFNTLMADSDLKRTGNKGYCYGISRAYLLNEGKDQGESYINHLKSLNNIINDNNNDITDPIKKAKHDALLMHAKAKMNTITGDILKIQFIHEKTAYYFEYMSKIDFNIINKNISFTQHINKIIDNKYNDYLTNLDNNENTDFYQNIYESQRIKAKKYMQALLANEDFFATPEGKAIANDQLFITLKNIFANRLATFEYNFTTEDIRCFIDTLYYDIQRDNFLKLWGPNELKGMNLIKDHVYTLANTIEPKNITSDDLINNIHAHIKDSRKSISYQIRTKNHAMAISIKYDTANDRFTYSYFDPNKGIYNFENQDSFAEFMNEFIAQNTETYKLSTNKNGEYTLMYSDNEFNSDSFYENKITNELNQKDIDITTNTLLTEREITVYLDKKNNNKLTYTNFNPETNIIEIEVSIDENIFYLYSDILDATDLKTKIDINLTKLSEIKGDVFISQDNYEIYSVGEKFDINTFKGFNQLSQLDEYYDYNSVNLYLKPLLGNEAKIITGIPKSHQKAITQVANDNNIIIGIRPIDHKSTSLIKSGEYSSKKLSIKGKSSDWGPHCGFIPVLQQFAKKTARENAIHYNDLIKQSIQENHAAVTQLEISAERLSELIDYKTVSNLIKIDESGYYHSTSMIDGKTYTFLFKEKIEGENKVWQVYYPDGEEIKPFQVLASPETKKAIIADYDLFSIIYPISELDKFGKTEKRKSWQEWKTSVDPEQLTNKENRLYHDQTEYDKQIGKDNGIINDKIIEIKNDINRQLGQELIHHGADDANPATIMAENFPITFFLPDALKKPRALSKTVHPIDTYFPMNKYGSIIINDVEQLSNFQQLLINQGYRAPLNRKWSEGENAPYFEPKRKLSKDFLEAKKVIEQQKYISIDNNKQTAIEKVFGKPIGQLNSEVTLLSDIPPPLPPKRKAGSSDDLPPALSPKQKATLNITPTIEDSPTATLALLKQYAIDANLIDKLNLADHPYLAPYFSNQKGELDLGKIHNVIDDPLISPKVNQFFSDPNKIDLAQWQAIFQLKQPQSLQQQAADIRILLTALGENPSLLNKLSHSSSQKLASLYALPAINTQQPTLNKIALLTLLTQPQQTELKQLQQQLDSFMILPQESIKATSLKQAIELQASHQALLIAESSQITQNTHIEATSHTQIYTFNPMQIHTPQGTHQSGLLYSFFISQHDRQSFDNFLKIKSRLEFKRNSGQLTPQESQLLQDCRRLSQSTLTAKDASQIKNDVDLKTIINTMNDDIYQINNEDITYTLSYHHNSKNNQHQYHLFSSNGLILNVQHHDNEQAQHDFLHTVTEHLRQMVLQPDGTLKTRAQLAGIDVSDTGKFTVMIQKNLITDTYSSASKLWGDIITSPILQSTSGINLILDEQKIPFDALHLLGATIDGQPLTREHLNLSDWQVKLRFDAQKLGSALTLQGKDQQTSTLLHLLKNRIDKYGINKIIDPRSAILESASVNMQLSIIQKEVGGNNAPIADKTFNKLQAQGMKLPRYAAAFNRIGQGTGGAGALLTLVSLNNMLDRLSQDDLSDAERKELEKLLALTCSQAFFNYGDTLLQPLLLRLSHLQSGSHYAMKTLPGKISIIFNLVGMGFDAYQAYDLFSQLEDTIDPNTRQDLIVNGGLAIGSFAVSGVVLVAVLAGSSVIPGIGLIIGAALFVAGMIYNAVRTVEGLKEHISLEWYEELEEGLRAVFQLPPTDRSIYQMNKSRWERHIKEQNELYEIERFRTFLLPSGFERYLTILGSPIIQQETTYHLVNEDKEFFGGDKKILRHINGIGDEYASQDNAPTYTSEEADYLLAHYNLMLEGKLHPRYTEGNSVFYKQDSSMPKYQMVGYAHTNDILVFDPKYNDDKFLEFIKKYLIAPKKIQDKPLIDQLMDIPNEKIRLLTLQKDYPTMHHPDMDDDIAISTLSETTIGDSDVNREKIAQQLLVSSRDGIAFNTGTGVDVVIGKKWEENAFVIQNGYKYFAGGNKDDHFQLWGTQFSLPLNQKINQFDKYLDGQGGTDTLSIHMLPEGHSAYINLQEEIALYKQSGTNNKHYVASIKNVENVFIQTPNATNDVLFGDKQNNLLSGGNGIDLLYGGSGNDQLLLTEGEAYGEDGQDSYYIERIFVNRHFNDFYQQKNKLDVSEVKFERLKSINPKYNLAQSFYHSITIHETDTSESYVNLGYSLDEIKSVSVSGTDMILKIEMQQGTIDSQDFSHLTNHIEITLKNVYHQVDNSWQRYHQYNIQTRDGFLLTSQLKEIANDEVMEANTDLLAITYLQDNDRLLKKGDIADIHVKTNKLFINRNRIYSKPIWGTFEPVGLARNLFYRGNNEDNQITYLNRNSVIYVSLGEDTYQIIPEQFEQNSILFDFSEVQQTYGKKDKVLIKLPTENGFQLKMEGSSLSLNNPFGGKKLAIHFRNFNQVLMDNVLIEDKYGNLFVVTLDAAGSQINPIKSKNDEEMELQGIRLLSQGYYAENGIIELDEKTTTLIDRSQSGHLFIGNNNDNYISATGGNNIFYGGTGTNVISGGEKDELFISDNGNDFLDGKAGDDHYLIDGNGNTSSVYINDHLGSNAVHLVNFSQKNKLELMPDGSLWSCYSSETGRIVKVIHSTKHRKFDNSIHHYAKLGALDSNKPNTTFASFQMSGILAGLKTAKTYANKMVNSNQWRPISMFNGVLKGNNQDVFWQQIPISRFTANGRTTINYTARLDFPHATGFHHSVSENGMTDDYEMKSLGGNNVFYGNGTRNRLSASGSEGENVFISNGTDDTLTGGLGATTFVVDGSTKGDTVIINAQRKDKIYLVGFNKTPIKRPKSLKDANEYVYKSENGRTVTLKTDDHALSAYESPSIYHCDELPGLVNTSSQQRIDYLISALASQLVEDSQSHATSIGQSPHHWQPVAYFENYIRRAG